MNLTVAILLTPSPVSLGLLSRAGDWSRGGAGPQIAVGGWRRLALNYQQGTYCERGLHLQVSDGGVSALGGGGVSALVSRAQLSQSHHYHARGISTCKQQMLRRVAMPPNKCHPARSWRSRLHGGRALRRLLLRFKPTSSHCSGSIVRRRPGPRHPWRRGWPAVAGAQLPACHLLQPCGWQRAPQGGAPLSGGQWDCWPAA